MDLVTFQKNYPKLTEFDWAVGQYYYCPPKQISFFSKVVSTFTETLKKIYEFFKKIVLSIYHFFKPIQLPKVDLQTKEPDPKKIRELWDQVIYDNHDGKSDSFINRCVDARLEHSRYDLIVLMDGEKLQNAFCSPDGPANGVYSNVAPQSKRDEKINSEKTLLIYRETSKSHIPFNSINPQNFDPDDYYKFLDKTRKSCPNRHQKIHFFYLYKDEGEGADSRVMRFLKGEGLSKYLTKTQ